MTVNFDCCSEVEARSFEPNRLTARANLQNCKSHISPDFRTD